MSGGAFGTWRRLAARARRREGWRAEAVRWSVPIVLGVLVSPVVRSVFLAFLDGGDVAAGLAGAWLRAALLVSTLASLEVHRRLLRNPMRPALATLPLDPEPLVRSELVEAARALGPVVVAVACSLGAVASSLGPGVYLRGVVVLAGAAALGAVLAGVVFLGAVRVACDPRWDGVLDAIRGQNPRAQAAIVWALAPSTAVVGWVTAVAASAIGSSSGWAWALLIMPSVLAAALAPQVPRLARSTWWRAGFVLADIQARYAAVERPEEVGRVWLDGLVRWLPRDVAREALLQLRHGWRERRGHLSVLWLAGLGAVVLGWTEATAGGVHAGLSVGAGALVVGVVPLLERRDEPAFLVAWLWRGDAVRALGAASVTVMWGAMPGWAALVAVGLRQGPAAGLRAVGVGLGLAAVAGVLSAAGVLARGAVRGYAAAAVLVLSAAAWGLA